MGEAKEPSFATTWWSFVSTFRQVTLSPCWIVIVPGEKPVLLIETVIVAAAPVDALAAQA